MKKITHEEARHANYDGNEDVVNSYIAQQQTFEEKVKRFLEVDPSSYYNIDRRIWPKLPEFQNLRAELKEMVGLK